MGAEITTYKRFPTSVWNLFEDLLKTRLSGIRGQLAELQIAVQKPNAAVAADTLATSRTLDGISFNGSDSVSHYGICNTTASEATKVVSCTGFTLVTGAEITVRFDVGNTSTDPLYLNVNNTGARLMKYHGVSITGTETLLEDYTYTFRYNGSWYELVGSLGKVYTDFIPATNLAAGENGLVPAPDTGTSISAYLDAGGNWTVPPDTTYSEFVPATPSSAGSSGLVPGPLLGDDATKFLNAAGAWVVPPDTTYIPFVAATSSVAGSDGLVPAPAIGDDATKFLNATGAWAIPPLATQSSDGYMSSNDKISIDTLYHQTSHAYSVGEQVRVVGQPNYLILECTEAGVSAAVSPDFSEDGFDYYESNTSYEVGDQVRVPGQPDYLVLECEVAGTTGSTPPDFSATSSS